MKRLFLLCLLWTFSVVCLRAQTHVEAVNSDSFAFPLLILSIVFSVAVIVSLWFVNRARLNAEKKAQLTAQAQALTEAELEKTKQQLEQIKKQASESETALKNIEKTYRDREFTDFLLRYIDQKVVLSETAKHLKKFKKQLPELDDTIKKIDRKLSDSNDRKDFKTRFERIYPRFFNALQTKFPSLTAADMRLSALLKLNLSSKEIAAVLNNSVQSVDNARSRLRSKLGLRAGEDLFDFLDQIEQAD